MWLRSAVLARSESNTIADFLKLVPFVTSTAACCADVGYFYSDASAPNSHFRTWSATASNLLSEIHSL